MSAPTIEVFMQFGASPNTPGVFTLNRSTLDGTDTLGGTQWVDVSQWLSGSIAITRGRSREVDAYQAGTCSFTLRNEDRRFDPTNTAGPYYPGIVPRTPVQITMHIQTPSGGAKRPTRPPIPIFTGYVEDYDLGYIKPNVCEVTVHSSDVFALLATAKLSGAVFSQQASGARISAVLARGEVSSPATVSIDAGLLTMQGRTVDGVAALDHCQAVTSSEGGVLLVDRFGTLQFHDHTYIAQQIAAWPNGQETFTDTGVSYNGEVYGYTDIGIRSGVSLLFNRVEGTRTGGTKQTANNAASQTSYNIRTLTLPTLENVNDADVLSLCQFLLGRYAQPEVRFDQVTVEFSGLSLEQQGVLAQTDLGSVVIAERTPPGGGTPALITQLSLVEHMGWSLDVSSSAYRLTLGLGNITGQAGFILDSTSFGLLDTDKLIF